MKRDKNEMKDYNVIIYERNFFDYSTKNNKITYESTYKIATS